MDNGEIVGDVMLGLFVAEKVADRYETKKAAQAEGITFEEMRLREQAAYYRSRASRPYPSSFLQCSIFCSYDMHFFLV